MKQIALLFPLTFLLLMGQSCQSGSESNSGEKEGLFAQKKTNEYTMIEQGPVYSFTVVPDKYDNCRAVFALSEDDLTSERFIFATDLRKSAVLAMDGRLIELELFTKRTVDLSAQFYKYEGKGYSVDLEIRKSEVIGNNLKKVRGQLKIFSESGFRDVFYIMGEIKC
ncbi:hypothetical protein KUV50_08480 [Membranicola marinus]|uniref:Lipoprotein n=1 Tax=Membranihabitans marinus TaxID=1227546 RepID=A0A953HM36_9BACT|nr:hypothetical protein [Membranihabitans marinus]MBY5958162.1 hypothetical protein [Membranihabitans marinus]